MKIHKGDTIQVIAGKDAGKKGKVEQVDTFAHTVFVPEVNTYKRHVKKSEAYPQGGIVQLSRALDISKVMLVCPSCNKLVRVGYSIKEGVKKRVCKQCEKVI